MRRSETSQTIKKHRILRNGKILIPTKKKLKKKNTNSNSQMSHNNCIKANYIGYNNTNDTDIYDKLLNKYDHVLNGRKLFIVLTKLPSISQTQLLPNHPNFNKNNKKNTNNTTNNNNNKSNNNNNYRNGYKKLENFISSNEIQIYDNLGIKMNFKSQLNVAKNQELQIPTPTIVNSINKIKIVKQKDEQVDKRITRGKSIKQKSEERKQLDKIMFDKFPNNTFKKFAVRLDDISKEVKFLSSLGLTFRCKCPLTYNKKRRM
ncbi:probable WRKY transcription factor protein 1 [Adelges cooleyi]|uniref:probable WRKY transcription factor protein 1 n=1 Tax=Adelges cooleyi TaxID=133065 RepID=UPI00217F5C86|nr:probable WRKY transcription factor protein 1 [Adelges cooleyi]